MIKAYSIDLREKVIQFTQSGKTQIETAKTFNIHKSTINHWLSRLRKEGSLKAKANLGSKPKINNEAVFSSSCHLGHTAYPTLDAGIHDPEHEKRVES